MKSLAAIAIVTSIVAAVPASAATRAPFSDAAFAAAQAAGKPILIEVHAPWCPVCAAQGRMIEKLTADGSAKDMMIFRIDFDSQKDLWKKFGAQKQSTIIAFRGRTETGRISYISDEASVAKLLASTRA